MNFRHPGYLLIVTLFFNSCGSGTSSPVIKECQDPSGDSAKLAKYRITFKATWSKETHPTEFPEDPHFSKIVTASHMSSYSMWSEAKTASPGVKEVAETGETSPLDTELEEAQKADKLCGFFIAGSGLKPSPGETQVEITLHEDFPLVSLITMIAPSPDWFVGISALSLRENDAWVDKKTLDAIPWDAGTDSGTTYTSEDQATSPAKTISILMNGPFTAPAGNAPLLGSFVVEKI